MTLNKTMVAHALGVITVCIWGVTFVNTKYLIRGGLDVTEIFLLRFSIAYACIWAWTIFSALRKKRQAANAGTVMTDGRNTTDGHDDPDGKNGKKSSGIRLWADNWKDELLFVLLGLTGGSVYFTTENIAVGLTYVNNVSFIVCTAPMITIVLAQLFTKSVRMGGWLIAGSLIALVGVAVVIFNGHFVLKLNPVGDLMALAAATCWALYSILIKKVSGGQYGAVFVTRKVFAYGILTILPIFAWRGFNFPLEGFAQPAVWGNLLFLGFVASFACFLVWSWVIKQIGALKTSNYVYLNPVTTVLASAVALDEPMTALAYVGSAMILGGVAMANWKEIEK